MKYGFGIDLGGTTVKIAYFDQEGTLLEKWEIPTDISDKGKNILPDIMASVRGYLTKNGVSDEQILGIGIGIPSPVDNHGNADICVNLGWPEFNIQDTLSQLSGFPVKAGNDATTAALGECWKGGHNCENMIFVTLGTGVGGGVVVGGNVIHGTHGSGGEIGHIVLRKDEQETCGCGKKGCAEQYCSATGIVRIAKRRLAHDDMASVLREQDLSAKAIFDAAKAGDALALEVTDTYFDYMGEFLADICLVVDPEVVVLGGGVSKAGQFLTDGVKPYFLKYSPPFGVRKVRFEIATLGNDAGVYGAFRLIQAETVK